MLCPVVFLGGADEAERVAEGVAGTGEAAPLAADSSQPLADSSLDLPDSSLRVPDSSHFGFCGFWASEWL